MIYLEKEMAGKLVIENKPGLAELFEWIDREPLLYHEVMVYFHKFKKFTKISLYQNCQT
jgi:hypothetical protein